MQIYFILAQTFIEEMVFWWFWLPLCNNVTMPLHYTFIYFILNHYCPFGIEMLLDYSKLSWGSTEEIPFLSHLFLFSLVCAEWLQLYT